MKGFEAVARALVLNGVDTVFSLPGDGNMFIDHSLNEKGLRRYVRAVREDGAVMMADGFTRVSGRLSLASVTLGPGLTNTTTALTTAARNGTPMLLVTGDTISTSDYHLQAVDQRALIATTGAGVVRVDRGGRIGEDIAGAVRACRVEQRPYVVMVPLDVQQTEVTPQDVVAPARAGTPHLPSSEQLDVALGIVASSRRVVLLAGRGTSMSGARCALRVLAERLCAPVATTVQNFGFFDDDSFDLKTMGTLSHSVADATLRAADCILVFGASLNPYTAASGSLLAGKAVVQCDIDPAAIGRHYPVQAGLVGDARAVAEVMSEQLAHLGPRSVSGRTPDLREALAALGATGPARQTDPSARPLTMSAFLECLDTVLPTARTLVLDGGRFIEAPVRAMSVPEPSAFLWTLGFGSIGLGIATSIGAAVARPDRPSVVVLGDGGFMMSLAEFSTAVRHRLDVVAVVLNNGGYGAEYRKFIDAGLPPDLSLFEWPDLAGVGRSLGAESMTFTDLVAHRPGLEALLARRSGPVLVDVRCDPADPMGRSGNG
jgi:thiamine pyrophosphate-dependent acetolactate synthase large subunit-like protein